MCWASSPSSSPLSSTSSSSSLPSSSSSSSSSPYHHNHHHHHSSSSSSSSSSRLSHHYRYTGTYCRTDFNVIYNPAYGACFSFNPSNVTKKSIYIAGEVSGKCLNYFRKGAYRLDPIIVTLNKSHNSTFLTYWDRDIMAAIFQTILSDAFF